VSAPVSLVYSANPAVYTEGVAILSNTPSSAGGAVTSYAVHPALPPGLTLSGISGVITGTPTAVTSAATDAVTASNIGGSTMAGLAIIVNAPSVSAPGVRVPTVGAYLGAWANPFGTAGLTPADVESNTQAVESQIGRRLSLHMHYFGWGTGGTPSFPDATMQSDLRAGRTPVVTWACGDLNASELIINTANAVKQFGAPMFIRWYWEMNLAAGANNQDCLGSGGPAGYTAAWQHIHDVFRAQGVTNVSWLWNPGGRKRGP
jgi:hypothetical protein